MRGVLVIVVVAGVGLAGPVQGVGRADAAKRACVKKRTGSSHSGATTRRRVCPRLKVGGGPHLPPNPPPTEWYPAY